MDINNMKNMVVLKNLPSNMIEEAFVVLKSNVKIHKMELMDKKKGKADKEEKNFTKECVVKEAQMIIEEYINKIEEQSFDAIKKNVKIKEKYNRLKALTIFLGIFSILCIITIFIK